MNVYKKKLPKGIKKMFARSNMLCYNIQEF